FTVVYCSKQFAGGFLPTPRWGVIGIHEFLRNSGELRRSAIPCRDRTRGGMAALRAPRQMVTVLRYLTLLQAVRWWIPPDPPVGGHRNPRISSKFGRTASQRDPLPG